MLVEMGTPTLNVGAIVLWTGLHGLSTSKPSTSVLAVTSPQTVSQTNPSSLKFLFV